MCTSLGKVSGILKSGEDMTCISRNTINAQLIGCSRIVRPSLHKSRESTFKAFGRMRRNEDSFGRISLPSVSGRSVTRPSTTLETSMSVTQSSSRAVNRSNRPLHPSAWNDWEDFPRLRHNVRICEQGRDRRKQLRAASGHTSQTSDAPRSRYDVETPE